LVHGGARTRRLRGKVTSTGNDLMDDGAVLNISGSIAAMIYSFSFMGMPVTASTTITTSSKELVIEYRFAKRKKRAMAERRAGGGPEEGRRRAGGWKRAEEDRRDSALYR